MTNLLQRADTYEEICRGFKWNIPEQYNIADDVCDAVHAVFVLIDLLAVVLGSVGVAFCKVCPLWGVQPAGALFVECSVLGEQGLEIGTGDVALGGDVSAGKADGEIGDAAAAGEGLGEGLCLQLCEAAGVEAATFTVMLKTTLDR